MIPREDARAIVYGLDPSRLVRLAYRAALRSGSGRASSPWLSPFLASAVLLDLESGALRVRCFHESDPRGLPPNLVILASADAALVEYVERRYGEGATLLPPSAEVLEESVARAAAADGIGVSWELFESQLRLAYDDDFDDEYDPGEASGGGDLRKGDAR